MCVGRACTQALAGKLAQEAERRTMAHFQRDGYKIIVFAELLSPGSGTAKNLVQLIDVTHDCVVSVRFLIVLLHDACL